MGSETGRFRDGWVRRRVGSETGGYRDVWDQRQTGPGGAHFFSSSRKTSPLRVLIAYITCPKFLASHTSVPKDAEILTTLSPTCTRSPSQLVTRSAGGVENTSCSAGGAWRGGGGAGPRLGVCSGASHQTLRATGMHLMCSQPADRRVRQVRRCCVGLSRAHQSVGVGSAGLHVCWQMQLYTVHQMHHSNSGARAVRWRVQTR